MNMKEHDEAMAAREGRNLYTVELTGAELRAVCDSLAFAQETMEARIGAGRYSADKLYAEPEITQGVFRMAQRQAVRAYGEFWKAECRPAVEARTAAEAR